MNESLLRPGVLDSRERLGIATIGAPKIVGGVGDRVKTDDGFKEVLSKIGENHKGSHLHKKSVKEIKTKEIVKKHMDIQSRK